MIDSAGFCALAYSQYLSFMDFFGNVPSVGAGFFDRFESFAYIVEEAGDIADMLGACPGHEADVQAIERVGRAYARILHGWKP